MATIIKDLTEWCGIELKIKADDYDVPDGFTLPRCVILCSAWVRGSRGNILGQRWYLQSHGANTDPGGIDLIGPDDIDGSYEIVETFLSKHGYQLIDDDCGVYRLPS